MSTEQESRVGPYDDGIYATGLRQLYAPLRGKMTAHQFVSAYTLRNPSVQHMVYQPFKVTYCTRSGMARPRSLVINPNSKNVVAKFLWDIRHSMGIAWEDFKERVNIFLNGRLLEAHVLVPALRKSPNYSLQIIPHENGAFVLPVTNPIADELEQQRLRDARRRAEREAGSASPQEVDKKVALLRVRDSIARSFADEMTTLSVRANQATPGAAMFRVIASPLATRATAAKVLHDPSHYKAVGYPDANTFFAQHLHAASSVDAINSISHEISAQMRKMPEKINANAADSLRTLYQRQAIGGPLMTQWTETVRGWFGKRGNAHSTGTYRVRNDYSLMIHDGSNSVSAPFHWSRTPQNPRTDPTAMPSEQIDSPFEPFQFQARTERTAARLQRYGRDSEALRRATGTTPAPAPVSAMPQVVAVPGQSVVEVPPPASMPLIASNIASSIPTLQAIKTAQTLVEDAVTDSMPHLVPKPAPVGAAVTESVSHLTPKPVPVGAAATESVPSLVPVTESVESLRSIQMPLFESMPNANLHKTYSIAADPLAAELARDVIASDVYSGVIVPDHTAIPAKTRTEMAAALRAASPQRRAAMVKPYMLGRINTSASINALLSGGAEPVTPVLAENMKAWHLSVDGTGKMSMRNMLTDAFVPVDVSRIQERPEAVIIHTPLSFKNGQK